MWSPALSKVLRVVVQPLVKFRQFADVKDAAVQGKGKGHVKAIVDPMKERDIPPYMADQISSAE
jgi:hypothetical protein